MRKDTEKAIEVAREAGKIALGYFEQLKDHHISTKDDGSLLTIADTEVDAYIRGALESAFPEHSVLSEESPNTRTTEGVWVIDPIDGTKNFANGNPNFGISIGFVLNSQPEIGVIFIPAKNKLYAGEKGGRAYCNGEIITVSKKANFEESQFLIDEGISEKTVRTHKQITSLVEGHNSNVHSWHCASLELCEIAQGTYEAMIHCRLNVWDIAAGIAIIEAAGGRISHLDGTPKDIFAPGIVASNTILHEQILALTKKCI
jgi:myo-inositol-1(or 4)-monophosphatase